mmetsp:Transcript_9818/g.16805  ORF Transcript_9818/g.16805 Transcript_9818/m.16805 type:complete len:167 (-) Transcript_9818:101-601(-)
MIKSVLIINNHGKVRLSSFYEHYTAQEQQQLIREVYQQLTKRSDYACNFLETTGGKWGKDTKLVYRHYATLYFIFCVDESESELGILDLIQVFVEALDKCFGDVCELDLIFKMDLAHYVLDEIVMGGMVLETNLTDIVEAVQSQNNLQNQEDPLSGIKNAIEKVQR